MAREPRTLPMRLRGSHLAPYLRYRPLNLWGRTARLAPPENLHPNSGDSEGDDEEEYEGSEEEDGDPLADLPDETEVHRNPRIHFGEFLIATR